VDIGRLLSLPPADEGPFQNAQEDDETTSRKQALMDLEEYPLVLELMHWTKPGSIAAAGNPMTVD
jgi:hypothetical protein